MKVFLDRSIYLVQEKMSSDKFDIKYVHDKLSESLVEPHEDVFMDPYLDAYKELNK